MSDSSQITAIWQCMIAVGSAVALRPSTQSFCYTVIAVRAKQPHTEPGTIGLQRCATSALTPCLFGRTSSTVSQRAQHSNTSGSTPAVNLAAAHSASGKWQGSPCLDGMAQWLRSCCAALLLCCRSLHHSSQGPGSVSMLLFHCCFARPGDIFVMHLTWCSAPAAHGS